MNSQHLIPRLLSILFWPYYTNRTFWQSLFITSLFQHPKKHPLFSTFLGKLPTKSKIVCLKNTHSRYPLSSMCTHHLTLWVVFPQSQHWPNCSNFQNPNHQTFKIQPLAQIHKLSTFYTILLFWLYHTDLIYRTQKSNIRALYFDIHFYFHRMSFIHTSFSPF